MKTFFDVNHINDERFVCLRMVEGKYINLKAESIVGKAAKIIDLKFQQSAGTIHLMYIGRMMTVYIYILFVFDFNSLKFYEIIIRKALHSKHVCKIGHVCISLNLCVYIDVL